MPTLIGNARNWVDLPPTPVATGGFLAAARVINVSDPHDLLGAEYLTDACGGVSRWPLDMCTPGDDVDEGNTKAFNLDPFHVVGDPFTLYSGVECNLQRLDQGAARARARFDYGERAGVDQAMFELLTALTTTTLSGGPMPVAEAVGRLEAYIVPEYGGPPTIVIPQGAMGCACQNGMVQRNLDGTLTTCSGSAVANYSIGDATPMHAFATGQVTLIRGEMSVISVPQQPFADGTYAPPRALAERTYVPLIECLVVRAEVTCS